MMSPQEDGAHRHKKAALLALAMVLFAAIVIVSLTREAIVRDRFYSVSVVGVGTVDYTPDIAKVTIGVQIDRATTADDALAQLSEKMDKVSLAIKTLGVDEAHVKTQSYTIYPHYEYTDGVSRVTGYDANQQLVVTLEKINEQKDMVQKVVKEATKVGSNQLLGVAFEASNVDDLKQEARLKALMDARKRAGQTARVAGVRLGKVIGWWDNFVEGPGVPGPYYEGKGGDGMNAGASFAPTPSGSERIKVETNVNYEIRY